MPNGCCVPGCRNVYKKRPNIRFHKFPFSRAKLYELWLRAICRENWIPKRDSRICSEHFKETDYNRQYIRNGHLIKVLTRDAVPSRNLPKNSMLSKMKNEPKIYCCVLGCSLNSENSPSTVFHSLNNQNNCDLYDSTLDEKSLYLSKQLKICDQHFHSTQLLSLSAENLDNNCHNVLVPGPNLKSVTDSSISDDSFMLSPADIPLAESSFFQQFDLNSDEIVDNYSEITSPVDSALLNVQEESNTQISAVKNIVPEKVQQKSVPEDIEYDLESICRVCLIDGDMKEIDTDSVHDIRIRDMLNKCMDYGCCNEEKMPKQICLNCAAELTFAYDFIKKFEHATETLMKFINKQNIIVKNTVEVDHKYFRSPDMLPNLSSNLEMEKIVINDDNLFGDLLNNESSDKEKEVKLDEVEEIVEMNEELGEQYNKVSNEIEISDSSETVFEDLIRKTPEEETQPVQENTNEDGPRILSVEEISDNELVSKSVEVYENEENFIIELITRSSDDESEDEIEETVDNIRKFINTSVDNEKSNNINEEIVKKANDNNRTIQNSDSIKEPIVKKNLTEEIPVEEAINNIKKLVSNSVDNEKSEDLVEETVKKPLVETTNIKNNSLEMLSISNLNNSEKSSIIDKEITTVFDGKDIKIKQNSQKMSKSISEAKNLENILKYSKNWPLTLNSKNIITYNNKKKNKINNSDLSGLLTQVNPNSQKVQVKYEVINEFDIKQMTSSDKLDKLNNGSINKSSIETVHEKLLTSKSELAEILNNAILNKQLTDEQIKELTKSSASNIVSNSGNLSKSFILTKAFSCKICNTLFFKQESLKTHFCEKKEKKLIIKCQRCAKIFDTRKELMLHKIAAHAIKRNIFCKICSKKIPSRLYAAHKQMHCQEMRFCCEFCGKRFKSTRAFNYHLNTHNTVKPFLCSVCGQGFNTKLKESEHRLTHSEEKIYMCHKCGRKFTQKTGLLQHIRKQRCFKNRFELKYKCTYENCEGKFYTKRLFEQHKREVHKIQEKKIFCEKCGSCFTTMGSLKNHMIIHSGEIFSCNICVQQFATYERLEIHRMSHELNEFTCEECDKSFNTKAMLVEHTKQHNGLKQYTCLFCPKSFIQKSLLDLHLRTHNKPHVCEFCGRNFNLKTNLIIHMRVHSPVVNTMRMRYNSIT